MNKHYTPDELLEAVSVANLGFTRNNRRVAGELHSYTAGTLQALFDILANPNMKNAGLAKSGENGHAWQAGYDSVVAFYVEMKE